MKPRFTDIARYRNGYTPSGKTDIRKTFNRIRAEQEKNAAEAKIKVAPLKKAVSK